MGQWRRLRRLGVLFLLSAGVLGAGGGGGPVAGPAQEVSVLGLAIDARSHQPTIVLQGKRDKRSFAMVIGPAEATGIVLPLEKVTPPRPLTHDLFLTLFGRLHVRLVKAVITDLRDDTYFATLVLSVNGATMEVDSRPSDAIALAIRANAPVFAEERVFEKAERLPSESPAPGSRI